MPALGNIRAVVSKVAGPVRAKASAVGGALKQKAARIGGPESGGMPSAETKLTPSVGQIEKHAKRAAGARDTIQQAAGVPLPPHPTGESFPPSTGGSVLEALATNPKLAPDVPSGWPAAQSGLGVLELSRATQDTVIDTSHMPSNVKAEAHVNVAAGRASADASASPASVDFSRTAADPQIREAMNTGETILAPTGTSSQANGTETAPSIATPTKAPDLIPQIDPNSPLGKAIQERAQIIADREPIKQRELAAAQAVIRGEAKPPKMVSFDEQLKVNQQRATQETAQQQGAQQSAEGAKASTTTPAKPEVKAGGTTDQKPGATSEPTPAEVRAQLVKQAAELDERFRKLEIHKNEPNYETNRANILAEKAKIQREIAFIDNPEAVLNKELAEAEKTYNDESKPREERIKAYQQIKAKKRELLDVRAKGKTPEQITAEAKKVAEQRVKGQRGGKGQIDRMMSLLQKDPDAMKKLAYTQDIDTSHDKEMVKFLRRVRQQELAAHGLQEWLGRRLQAAFRPKAFQAGLQQRELEAAQEQLRALTANTEEMKQMQEEYPKRMNPLLAFLLFMGLIIGKELLDTAQDVGNTTMQDQARAQ